MSLWSDAWMKQGCSHRARLCGGARIVFAFTRLEMGSTAAPMRGGGGSLISARIFVRSATYQTDTILHRTIIRIINRSRPHLDRDALLL